MAQKMTDKIESVQFRKALGDRYLSYAMSTIVSRSLPDVRDGLKPVTRRILYAMHEMKIMPSGATKKSARVVGSVQGMYHPHGDKAVYDALVRLVQPFVMRYPLVKGQGNFGSIDGDEAAAARYTEVKLSTNALMLLEGIHENAVAFRPNYDGSEQEPVVLPAAFPNLLANGAIGIAVGMATSILPHNVDELCAAVIHLLDHPDADLDDIMSHIPGPDLPTGGTIVDATDVIKHAYNTGRGSIRVRCRYEIEQLKGGGYQIIVTEIPYLVQKSKLIEKTADLLLAKKLPLLADIQDESAQDIRIILTPKSRQVDPDLLMSTLFKNTDFETRLSMNMNVLTSTGVPKVLSLIEILKEFIQSRYDILHARTNYRIDKIAKRLEILDGFIIVFAHIDEVIAIIRTADDPKAEIMKKWGLSDIQTEAILNIKLRTLQKLEEIAIRQEHQSLLDEKQDLESLLGSKAKQTTAIKKQISDVRKTFSQQKELALRRTNFKVAPEVTDIPTEAFVNKEAATLICSKKGWIRTLKGTVETGEVKYKDGDKAFFASACMTTDKALIMTSDGRFYTLNIHELPSGRGFGEPLSVILDLAADVSVRQILIYSEGQAQDKFLVAASDGRGFLINKGDLIAQTRNGRQVLNISGETQALLCKAVTGDYIAVVGDNRRLVIFKVDELPTMSKGRGITLQKYRSGVLSDVAFFSEEEGLSWQIGKRTYQFEDWREWISKRGLAGRFVPAGFPRATKFSS
ncbi:MAG: DNA topoisomerase IV subunit A [Rickettsiales bacterium]|nr:DNA topoisomerase IV subunit A [Rickettsiales bacterium]|tara:strand:+ start:27137 stop:29365 length:2229 start_codon:yes stop_codon:yes gene_type:complete